MPVILATQEAEIRRLEVQSQPRQIVLPDPVLENRFAGKGWWWLKVWVLSSSPTTAKRRRGRRRQEGGTKGEREGGKEGETEEEAACVQVTRPETAHQRIQNFPLSNLSSFTVHLENFSVHTAPLTRSPSCELLVILHTLATTPAAALFRQSHCPTLQEGG
jgi:hypothetical protein